MTVRASVPVIVWQMIEVGREWRAEYAGLRLAVQKRTNVGTMYEGFINGGRVLRARRSNTAKERLAVEARKRATSCPAGPASI